MEILKLAIVDDEEDILKSLKRILRKQFDISSFISAQECLDYLDENSVDILLSDIRMPFIDGFELMARVKEKHPNIVRLSFSGYADMESCQKAIDDGLFEYIIAKPWDNYELRQLLKVYAENISLKKQLAVLGQCEQWKV